MLGIQQVEGSKSNLWVQRALPHDCSCSAVVCKMRNIRNLMTCVIFKTLAAARALPTVPASTQTLGLAKTIAEMWFQARNLSRFCGQRPLSRPKDGIEDDLCIEFLRIATVAASIFTRLPRPQAAAGKRKRQAKEEAAGSARSRYNYMQVLRVYSVDLDASGGLGQYHALKYAMHGGGFALFT